MSNEEAVEQAYRNAIEVAKAELDVMLPVLQQVRNRVSQLRMLVTSASELVGEPLQPDDEHHYRYDSFMSVTIRNRMEERERQREQREVRRDARKGGAPRRQEGKLEWRPPEPRDP